MKTSTSRPIWFRAIGQAASLLVLTAGLILSYTGCLNECSYWEACDGNTLLVCGAGSDQMVGRKVKQHPCEEPNPVCVQQDEHAQCAINESDSCQDNYEPTCDGDLLIFCGTVGFLYATDCAAEGQSCALASGDALAHCE